MRPLLPLLVLTACVERQAMVPEIARPVASGPFLFATPTRAAEPTPARFAGPLPASLAALGGDWRAFPLLLLAACRSAPTPTPPPPTPGGVVAADHPLASEAGAAMLRAGGNAVDAAVAAALVGGVVQPQSSGLGGGGFALVVGPGVQAIVLDFREVAPAAAHADMFLDAQGAVIPGLSEHGALAVAVPGEPRGLAAVQARYGRLGLAAVAEPAVRLAREGFPAGHSLVEAAQAWHEEHGDALFPQLFDGCEGPPTEGQVLRRGRLADSIEVWGASGGEALNTGPRAAALASDLQLEGGLLTAADLAGYTVRDRSPLLTNYRGWTILTVPPPSSGGLVILQALEVLEAWPALGADPLTPTEVHRTVEALKHGFADRARWMGDPDFVDVPVGRLLDSAHITAIQVLVRLTGEPPAEPAPDFAGADCRTLPAAAYGLPLDPGDDAGTAHISVLDGDGLAVALTTTINTSFGSGVVDPGTGLLLNDQLDDFVAAPGVRNAYGLVGNARNAIAPGKRPLSSMSPTVVLDAQGQPLLVIGASGGPRIISGTFLVLRAVLESGLAPAEALALPRYHHQWSPDELQREPELSFDTSLCLAACGHTMGHGSAGSAVQVVLRRPDGRLEGASDPRKGGAPASAAAAPAWEGWTSGRE